jgi:hypothetical protein
MKKQTISTILCMLLTTISGGLFAQSVPVSDTLHVNSIRARVQSNGAFFQGGSNGQFLVPTTTIGSPELSLIKSAGLWIGGRDLAGNLRLSAQIANENGKADFYPGALMQDGTPYPAFNFIADVTRAQVNAHKANPGSQIPAIYGWPGRGNPFFSSYHDFDLPYSWGHLASFYDAFNNGAYNPDDGDYPVLGLRGCPEKYNAEEQLWFDFHDVGPHTQSGGAALNMEIQGEFFGFDCPEGTPLNRVVYVTYTLINRDTVPLDSCYFGVYLDFEIGNGNDDYIGCDDAKRFVYAYNGDDVDEGGFENSPPVMAVDLLRGPLNGDTGEEIDEWHFVPVDESGLNAPEAYYNLLKGRQTNGTPFPNNGKMYTGDPLNPNAWSEVSDGNIPGERKALASFGPFTLYPGALNELILGYFWVRKGATGSVAENLTVLEANDKKVQDLFDNCFNLSEGCPGNVSTNDPASGLSIVVSPNPFTDWVRVESGAAPMQSVFLYDATGRLVEEITAGGAETVTIQTGNLPSGLYGLQVRTKDGRSGCYKLIHE